MALATNAGLGSDLVVQTPYGDSGKTTFFIKSEADWDKDAELMAAEELKVMKRIRNKAAAVEGVITRHGTIVGPFMTDLTGYSELTPYKGGWCGNDVYPEALSPTQRETATGHVRRLGDRLAQEGYRGFFEVDVLVDLDTDEVYLGELNPRISGASSMTNVTAGAYADVPLFLFHLLEWMDVDYTIDVDEINERWLSLAAVDVWAQLIMKEPHDRVERLLATPRTGTYNISPDGEIEFAGSATDWHQLTHEDEFFYLRVYGPGDYRFKGADLGVLVTKARMQSGAKLTPRALRVHRGGPFALLRRADRTGARTSRRSPTSSRTARDRDGRQGLLELHQRAVRSGGLRADHRRGQSAHRRGLRAGGAVRAGGSRPGVRGRRRRVRRLARHHARPAAGARC